MVCYGSRVQQKYRFLFLKNSNSLCFYRGLFNCCSCLWFPLERSRNCLVLEIGLNLPNENGKPTMLSMLTSVRLCGFQNPKHQK